MRHATLALCLGSAVACTVGPGGSFPETAGNTAAATTVSTTATTDPDDSTGASESGTSVGSSGGSSGAPTSEPTTAMADATEGSGEGMTEPGEVDSSSGADSAAGTPLDPDLDIPDGGEQCDYPGDLNECPGIAVCRFATAEYGLCESCDACGNLFAPCTEGTDCDILFSCYAGSCTNFCTLGSFECGPVEDCLDIGHPTRGVCDPFA